jgi:DNA-binding NtrC family response regulator
VDDIIKQIGTGLAEQITKQVLENIRREMTTFHRQNYRFCYSEEEAAAKLGVDKSTLYNRRKNGEIGYSRSPSGKPVYLPRHIDDYLARHEVRSL